MTIGVIRWASQNRTELNSLLFFDFAQGFGFEPHVNFDPNAKRPRDRREFGQRNKPELAIMARDQPEGFIGAVPLGQVTGPASAGIEEFDIGNGVVALAF